jgi:hypothetical protein
MHSIDGIPMEDPNTIPPELRISDEAKGYIDRVIKLNTEAMGDRDEWDAHGNATLDLVREMAGEMDALRRALEPFVSFSENVDADGWTSSIHREQISTWFGPSDFRRAREALSQ